MCKSAVRLFSLLLCGICIIFCSSCNGFSSSPVTITKLNETYEGSTAKVTATEIKTKSVTSTDEILIGVKFKIENISNKDLSHFTSAINAYVDDAYAERKVRDDFGDDLYGAIIAPGKYLSGYHYVTAPANAKFIELHFDENGDSAIFAFDIPSPADTSDVESTVSMEDTTNTDSTTDTESAIPENTTADSTSAVESTSEVPSEELLTLEAYNQIETGMTYNQISGLLGSDGTLFTAFGTEGTSSYMATYQWINSETSYALFVFLGENMELVSKSQIGLE